LDSSSDATTLTGRDLFFEGPTSTITGALPDSERLTLSSSRVARFDAAVTALRSLAVAAMTRIDLNAGTVTTLEDQAYSGAVRVDSPAGLTTLAGRDLRWTATLAGGTVTHRLSVTGREIDFAGGPATVSNLAQLSLGGGSGATAILLGGAADLGANTLDITTT
ncbi:MAG: hypothetical protein ACKOJF_10395, partial [Planctomycetaceae bacterium]